MQAVKPRHASDLCKAAQGADSKLSAPAGTLMDWNFTTFRTLNLSNNLFAGTLPDNVGSYWASMQTLDLSRNNISGPLPPGELSAAHSGSALLRSHAQRRASKETSDTTLSATSCPGELGSSWTSMQTLDLSPSLPPGELFANQSASACSYAQRQASKQTVSYILP